MVSICVFGDSIAEGYYDSENGGRVALLSRFLKTPNEKLHIYNCSICGDSTKEVLHRFDNELSARESKIIIFALGTNDSWFYDNDKNKPNVSLTDFSNNLNQLITKAKNVKAKIFFIGSPNVDEKKVSPFHGGCTIFYDNQNIQKYNQIIKETCKEHNLTFIPTFHLLENEDLKDGLHPNTKGHKKLFEEIKKHFLDLK
jgi:lysophospholipase L1-like esterase